MMEWLDMSRKVVTTMRIEALVFDVYVYETGLHQSLVQATVCLAVDRWSMNSSNQCV